MSFGKIEIQYTDPASGSHTFRKYFSMTSDAGTFLASPGSTIALSGVTPGTGSVNAGLLIRSWCKAYEFLAATGATIDSITADWRADGGGPATVDASATYFVSDFTPGGGAPGYGPRKAGFMAFPGYVPVSRKTGWLRFYSSSATVWGSLQSADPTTIDADFADFLDDFIRPSGGIVGFAIWSGYSVPEGSWLVQNPFNISVYRLGDRNG